jgi:hypothetical protein
MRVPVLGMLLLAASCGSRERPASAPPPASTVRATLGVLRLPDGRSRDAFDDGTACAGECIPTDAHFGCHLDADRCIP